MMPEFLCELPEGYWWRLGPETKKQYSVDLTWINTPTGRYGLFLMQSIPKTEYKWSWRHFDYVKKTTYDSIVIEKYVVDQNLFPLNEDRLGGISAELLERLEEKIKLNSLTGDYGKPQT